MKGSSKVIERLNALLVGELSAADQYFCHAHMYQNWGLSKLYERIEHERHDELEHAKALIERILFLEGVPEVGKRDPLRIGKDVPSMLANDLAVEIEVVAALKEVIALCEAEQDYQTRHILREMLADTEEDHAHWLEQQLGLIKLMGLENYLQSAMGGINEGNS